MSFFEELKRRNVIRVAIAYGVGAWFALQLADVVLENINAPDWVMQAVMMVLAIGLPVVVLLAWAFEMTPEGIKKEKDVDRSQSITAVTGRKLDRMIIGIMAVVIAFLVLEAGWLYTVLEGYFLGQLLNLIEHACYAVSSVFLCAWCWQAFIRRQGRC